MEKEILEKVFESEAWENSAQGKYLGEDFLIISSTEDEEKLSELTPEGNIEYLLEQLNIKDWGFADEFCLCSRCSENVINTSYANITPYIIKDGEISCKECFVEEDLSEYINNYKKAAPHEFRKFLENDWKLLEEKDFQDGHDSPESYISEIKKNMSNFDFVFLYTFVHMFGVSTELWIREKGEEDE